MDFIEVEGKTYEEAIRKASAALNAEEKDLDIDVKEVDTKGILGLLGSKKIRITARLREKELTPEEYGQQFLLEMSNLVGLSFNTKVSQYEDRIIFLVQCDDGDILIGKDGETLESVQHILRLAIAKRYKQGLKVLVDINGYREKRKKALTIMAKRIADKAKKSGKKIKTDPLNPYERRIVHTLFKHNKGITTRSEGEGHTKKVVITPVGNMNGKR
ncbi:MAG: protein jag [Syntrophus sp. (in: bacteria)]|nr:protein jag [Syntrophus sp. (in: bacteria)]